VKKCYFCFLICILPDGERLRTKSFDDSQANDVVAFDGLRIGKARYEVQTKTCENGRQRRGVTSKAINLTSTSLSIASFYTNSQCQVSCTRCTKLHRVSIGSLDRCKNLHSNLWTAQRIECENLPTRS
jgi:hypothetical protein